MSSLWGVVVFGDKSYSYSFLVWYPNLSFKPPEVVLPLTYPQRYAFHFFLSFIQASLDSLDLVVVLACSLYFPCVLISKFGRFHYVEFDIFGLGISQSPSLGSKISTFFGSLLSPAWVGLLLFL